MMVRLISSLVVLCAILVGPATGGRSLSGGHTQETWKEALGLQIKEVLEDRFPQSPDLTEAFTLFQMKMLDCFSPVLDQEGYRALPANPP